MSLDKHLVSLQLKSATGLPRRFLGLAKYSPYCEITFRGERLQSQWISKREYDETAEWNETFTWHMEDAPRHEESLEITILHRSDLLGHPHEVAKAVISLACVLNQGDANLSPAGSSDVEVLLLSPQNDPLGSESKLQVDVSYTPPVSNLVRDKDAEIFEVKKQLETVKAVTAGKEAEAKAEMTQVKDENIRLRSAAADREVELSKAKDELSEMKQQVETLEVAVTAKERELSKAKDELSEMKQQVETVEVAVTAKERELTEAKADIDQLKEENQRQKAASAERVAELSRELTETKAEIKELQKQNVPPPEDPEPYACVLL